MPSAAPDRPCAEAGDGGRSDGWRRLKNLDDALEDLTALMPFARFIEGADGRVATMDTRMQAWLGHDARAPGLSRRVEDHLTSESRSLWDHRGWHAPDRREGPGLDLDWLPAQGPARAGAVFYRALVGEAGLQGQRQAFVFDTRCDRLLRADPPWAADAEASRTALFLTDGAGHLLALDSAFTVLTGHTVGQAVGQHVDALALETASSEGTLSSLLAQALQRGAWAGEVRWRHTDGHAVDASLLLQAWTTASGAVRVAGRLAPRVPGVPSRLPSDHSIDLLTGFLNRQALHKALQRALDAARRDQVAGALLLLDLDHFKLINDTSGHDQGDRLLSRVAKRLRHTLRTNDVLARLGGDEFVVVLGDVSDSQSVLVDVARRIADKVLASLSQPFQGDGLDYVGTASLGISLFTGAEPLSTVLQQADLAMYEAKRRGRNQSCVFESAMLQSVTQQAELARELARALPLAQFHLVYQPQVGEAGRWLGAEVLLRWTHPTRGSVSPAEFIPVAESSGAILAIGPWVLDQACQQLARWALRPETRDLTLAVNVSARQFAHPGFVDAVQATLVLYQVPPARLTLELTESMVHDVDDIRCKMATLRQVGVRFAMDDFGTGYSSLSSLTQLPLAELKIDRSFVSHMADRPSDAIVVQTIVSMAHSLGLSVVAEGVETAQQRDLLLASGCTHFQGYWFGKPVPIAEFEAALMR